MRVGSTLALAVAAVAALCPTAGAATTCAAGEQAYAAASTVCAAAPVAHFGFGVVVRKGKVTTVIVSPSAKGQRITARCVTKCSRGPKSAVRRATGTTTNLAVSPMRLRVGSVVEVTVRQAGLTSRQTGLAVLRRAPFLERRSEGCLAVKNQPAVPCDPPAGASPPPAPAGSSSPAANTTPSSGVGSSPTGKLVRVERLSMTVMRVTGWAIDPDQPGGKVDIVGTSDGAIGGTGTANLERTDVGGGHGFSFTVTVPVAGARLCIRAVDLGAAAPTDLGCQQLGNGKDINGDGQVNCNDLAQQNPYLGSTAAASPGDPNIYIWGDLNGDGTVDAMDVSLMTASMPAAGCAGGGPTD